MIWRLYRFRAIAPTRRLPHSIGWMTGQGKSVAAQVNISATTLQTSLQTDIDTLINLNNCKNLIGSALVGSLGGFNAHASNIVSAMFLATGQDIAQNVEISSCLTSMRKLENGDLQISVFMPSIEVGTNGGRTVLEAQRTRLDLMGVRGVQEHAPGFNVQQLARAVAAGVLVGELSLLSALATGTLVKCHMALDRK